jgi:orotate phosphoribosyltransferase
VLVIEDLVSTGKSIALNVNAIREAGGKVSQCLAITTSTIAGFVETVTNLNIELLTLTNIQTVIETAAAENYITVEQSKSVYSFLSNPKTWGHEMGFE